MRIFRNCKKPFVFCSVFFLSAIVFAVPANAEKLKRVAPQLKVFEPDASHIFHAPDVPAATLKSLAAIPLEKLRSSVYPAIYKMPQSRNLYLVAVTRDEGNESEYVLLRQEDNVLVELQRTPAVAETIVNTTFFVGKSRVLIVAEMAVPPDFDRLEIFDFNQNKLSPLSGLTVAEKNKPTGLHDDFISPAGKMTAEYKSNKYYLRLTGNLYTDWGGEESAEEKLKSPATYFYDGKSFRRL